MAQQNRVQFDFTDAALEELDGLKLVAGIKTRAEVIRYALKIMQWVLQQMRDGGRILVEKNGKVEGVVFPFLGNAQPLNQQRVVAARPLVASR